MRVIFNTYPWAFETPGGGEIQLQKYEEHLPSHGVNVLRYDPWRTNLTDIDAVHFFSCIGGSVHFCNYVRQRGIPLIISSSLWVTSETLHLYPGDEIRHQLSLADVVVTNSETESDLLSDVLQLPRNKFASVMNGIDQRFTERQDPTIFRQAFSIDGPFILNVGNVEPRKNQLELVRATAHLSLPLVLIGHLRDPTYAAQVMAEGQGRIHYLGPLDHEDPRLMSAMAACSVFVLPSTLETPGLAALEAAAVGAPVVVTSEGSTRDYFGTYAEYINHRETIDIRRGIDAALAAGSRPELKSHIAECFGWPAVTRALVEVYSTAISRASSRSA